jgi:hypothetical protein
MGKGQKPDTVIDEAPVAPAARAPEAERRTVEDWGLAKGLLPERIQPTGATVMARPIEGDRGGAYLVDARHAPGTRVNPETWKWNAAKLRRAWPIGKMVTEAEFDAAIAEVTSPDIVCR